MHLQSISENNLLNVRGRLRKQEKLTPSLVHPTIYSTPGPLPPSSYRNCPMDWKINYIYECVFPQTIVLWIGQYILFMSTCEFQYT